MQSGLVSSYRETDYVAYDNGRIVVVRIGHRSMVVDKLLSRMHVKSGAFITAWNPFSRSLSFKANETRNHELKRDLVVRGISFVEGEGRGRTGEWPAELSIFAFGISLTEASTIGRRYRQNAIVYVPRCRPAELVMLRWVR
jgi:hypothetical protein